MAQVFISYDREDRDFAEVLQAKLEKAGHTTMMDFDLLNAGDDWQDRLDEAIRGSQALVVIMTPEARASDYVAYEWAFALGAGVKVIPIELKATTFSARLDALHRLEFKERLRPWDTLLGEVAKAEAANPRTSIPIDPAAPAPVKHAARAVDSLDAGERRKAIRILSEADHPSAREALAHALEHPLADVRIAAACLYPDASDARILPGLVEAACDNAWREYLGNKVFSDRVAEIGSAAVPGLLSALDSASEEWKPMLLEALGTVGGADVRPVLLEGLKSANGRTREAAAAAFGRSGDPEGVPSLLDALRDAQATVRDAAAWSLGLLKATQGVSELSRMAVEDTPRCRVTAARSLGRIGDPTAIPSLAAALEDGEVEVRRAAIEALGALGAASTIPDMRELLQQGAESDQISETDSTLMMTLLQLNDAEAVPLIEARLTRFRSGLFAHVEEICVSMARFGENGVAAVIRVLENAASGSVQGKAVAALERIGSPLGAEAAKAWRRTHG